jgi:hypothetical protein
MRRAIQTAGQACAFSRPAGKAAAGGCRFMGEEARQRVNSRQLIMILAADQASTQSSRTALPSADKYADCKECVDDLAFF